MAVSWQDSAAITESSDTYLSHMKTIASTMHGHHKENLSDHLWKTSDKMKDKTYVSCFYGNSKE